MRGTLKSKVVNALSWSAVQEVATRGLQLAVSIVLARLLMPEHFGLLAMLTVFVAVSQALLDSGFGSALIQRKQPTEVEKSSVFYLNLIASLFLIGVLWLAAPGIAKFYAQPQLVGLTRALSLLLLINAFVVVQNALVVRDLNFKRMTIISTIGTVSGGVLGVILAWSGFGVWSLVAQQLTGAAIRASLFWRFSTWRPTAGLNFGALREMFSFGSRMAASSILNTIFTNLYSLVIGKLFSAASLGYYTRAQTLQAMPAHSLGTVAARVAFPVFSQLQNEPDRLRRGMRKAIRVTAFLQFPMMFGLAAVAEPLVLFLLTDKWAPSIPYLQLACFMGVWYPFHLLNLNALTGIGRSDLFLRLEVIKKLLIILNIAVTYRWGIMAMMWGQVVNGALGFVINSYYSKRHLGYSTLQQLADMSPYILTAGVMGVLVVMLDWPLNFGLLFDLGLKVIVGAAVYGAVAWMFRFSAIENGVDLFHHREGNAAPQKLAAMQAQAVSKSVSHAA